MAAKKTAAKAKVRKKTNPKMSGNPGATIKKLSPATKPYTKTEMLNAITSLTGTTKKHVSDILDSLPKVIECHLKKGGVGNFTLPGLLKFQVIHKPATRARKGINPFTGMETMFKAKPARNVVKVKALKRLKDMV